MSASRRHRRTVGVLEDPARRLAVPHERVADDEHAVALTELHVASAGAKLYVFGCGWTSSHFNTFSGVIVLNCALHERRADGIAFRELILIRAPRRHEMRRRTRS